MSYDGQSAFPTKDYGHRGIQPGLDPTPSFPSPPPSPSSPWKYLAGAGCGCLSLVGLAVIAFFVWAVNQPTDDSIPGGQLTPAVRSYLEAKGGLEPGQKVIYYYGYIDAEDAEDFDGFKGCYFTEDRIVYFTEDGSFSEAAMADALRVTSREDFLEHVVQVELKDGSYWKCALISGGPDFETALRDTITRRIEAVPAEVGTGPADPLDDGGGGE